MLRKKGAAKNLEIPKAYHDLRFKERGDGMTFLETQASLHVSQGNLREGAGGKAVADPGWSDEGFGKL